MTPTESVKLVALVQAAMPGMKMTEATPDVWHALLQDIPFDHAQQAVYRHARTSGKWIAPADVRRLVADSLGLLPPPPEQALALAFEWATGERLSLADLPEAVAATCRQLRSSFIAEQPSGIVRQRFLATYGENVKACEERLLSRDMSAHILVRADRLAVSS